MAILIMLFLPRGLWGEFARRLNVPLFPTQRLIRRLDPGADAGGANPRG